MAQQARGPAAAAARPKGHAMQQSVANAAMLFGGGGGGGGGDDPFASIGSISEGPEEEEAPPPQQQQHYQQQPAAAADIFNASTSSEALALATPKAASSSLPGATTNYAAAGTGFADQALPSPSKLFDESGGGDGVGQDWLGGTGQSASEQQGYPATSAAAAAQGQQGGYYDYSGYGQYNYQAQGYDQSGGDAAAAAAASAGSESTYVGYGYNGEQSTQQQGFYGYSGSQDGHANGYEQQQQHAHPVYDAHQTHHSEAHGYEPSAYQGGYYGQQEEQQQQPIQETHSAQASWNHHYGGEQPEQAYAPPDQRYSNGYHDSSQQNQQQHLHEQQGQQQYGQDQYGYDYSQNTQHDPYALQSNQQAQQQSPYAPQHDQYAPQQNSYAAARSATGPYDAAAAPQQDGYAFEQANSAQAYAAHHQQTTYDGQYDSSNFAQADNDAASYDTGAHQQGYGDQGSYFPVQSSAIDAQAGGRPVEDYEYMQDSQGRSDPQAPHDTPSAEQVATSAQPPHTAENDPYSFFNQPPQQHELAQSSDAGLAENATAIDEVEGGKCEVSGNDGAQPAPSLSAAAELSPNERAETGEGAQVDNPEASASQRTGTDDGGSTVGDKTTIVNPESEPSESHERGDVETLDFGKLAIDGVEPTSLGMSEPGEQPAASQTRTDQERISSGEQGSTMAVGNHGAGDSAGYAQSDAEAYPYYADTGSQAPIQEYGAFAEEGGDSLYSKLSSASHQYRQVPDMYGSHQQEEVASQATSQQGGGYYEHESTYTHDEPTVTDAYGYGGSDSYGAQGGNLYAPPSADPYAPQTNSPYTPAASGSHTSSYDPYAPPSVNAYSPRADPDGYAPIDDSHTSSYTPQSHIQGHLNKPPHEARSQTPTYQNGPFQHFEDQIADGYGRARSAYTPGETYDSHQRGISEPWSSNASYDPRGQDSDPYAAQQNAPTGQDDPLTRQRTCISLISFSASGQLVTYFPHFASAGSSGAHGLAHRTAPTTLSMRKFSQVVPPSSYATSLDPASFPGPLFDATSQNSALSRATGGSAAHVKAKKAAVIKHLNDSLGEMSSGIGYLTGVRAAEGRRMQDRIVLVRVLVALLEHDGNHVNNASFDRAVVDVLLEHDSSLDADAQATSTLPSEPSYQPTPDPRFLSRLQTMLSRGQRHEAVAFAREQRMWTHAVIIASGMDKETWRDVVSAFMREELNGEKNQTLRVAYGLFSGQEPKSFYDVFRPKEKFGQSGPNATDTQGSTNDSDWRRAAAIVLANRQGGDSASLTAIGDGLALAGKIEAAHVCYLLSPQSSALDGYDAPGARYTLLGTHSPQASSAYLRDLDATMLTEVYEFALGLRTIPKGGEPYHGLPFLQPYRVIHAIHLAELGETKKALKYCEAITNVLKVGKMNRYFHPVLLQSLQELADRLNGDGKVNISAASGSGWLKKKPTVDGVWGALEGRFTKFIAGEDDSATEKTPTRQAPSVGPFSHFSAITPDVNSRGVSRAASFADISQSQSAQGGPSSTYSYSRPASRSSNGTDSQFRNGMSPMVSAPAGASSANRLQSQWLSPSGHGVAASPSVGYTSGQSTDTDMYAGAFTSHTTGAAPWTSTNDTERNDDEEDGGLARGNEQGSHYGYEPHGAERPGFVSNVDGASGPTSGDGLLSPMDTLSSAPTPTFGTDAYAPNNNRQRGEPADLEGDDEDLGFGNKPSKRDRSEDEADDANDRTATFEDKAKNVSRGGPSKSAPIAKQDGKAADDKDKKPELKPASSWLGRFWGGRREASEGDAKAVKAHLGEEVSFYYDKDLKRWVNKKAGDTPQAAAPPPAPPRAATASPSVGQGGGPPRSFSAVQTPPMGSEREDAPSPPQQRSASGPSLSGNDGSPSPVPPAGPLRQRSNLADHSQPPALQPNSSRSGTGAPEAVPGARPGGGPPPPPPSGAPGGGAKKKPINKRYVRVD